MAWSRGVGPVCLPFYSANDDFSGDDVIATGWGTTEFGGPVSDYLRKVDLTVLSNSDEKCVSAYPKIQDSQLCAYKEGKDTCQVSLIKIGNWKTGMDIPFLGQETFPLFYSFNATFRRILKECSGKNSKLR